MVLIVVYSVSNGFVVLNTSLAEESDYNLIVT